MNLFQVYPSEMKIRTAWRELALFYSYLVIFSAARTICSIGGYVIIRTPTEYQINPSHTAYTSLVT